MRLQRCFTLIGIGALLLSVDGASEGSSRGGRPTGICSTKQGKSIYNKVYKILHADQVKQYNSEYHAKMPTEKKEERKNNNRAYNANRYRSDREIVERTHDVPPEQLSEDTIAQLTIAKERIQKEKDSAWERYKKYREDPVKCSENRLKNNVRLLAAKHRADPTKEPNFKDKIAGYVSTEAGRGFVSGDKLHSMAWDAWKNYKPSNRMTHKGTRLVPSSSSRA